MKDPFTKLQSTNVARGSFSVLGSPSHSRRSRAKKACSGIARHLHSVSVSLRCFLLRFTVAMRTQATLLTRRPTWWTLSPTTGGWQLSLVRFGKDRRKWSRSACHHRSERAGYKSDWRFLLSLSESNPERGFFMSQPLCSSKIPLRLYLRCSCRCTTSRCVIYLYTLSCRWFRFQEVLPERRHPNVCRLQLSCPFFSFHEVLPGRAIDAISTCRLHLFIMPIFPFPGSVSGETPRKQSRSTQVHI